MNVIRDVATETQAGRMTFPEVVQRLTAAGVESYFVDFAAGSETFYLRDGGVQIEAMRLRAEAVAEDFSAQGLVGAIRGAQADAVRYPEFVKRSTDAGVIGYWAFLTGRKVIYFGRRGEMHVEDFPGANS